MFGLRDFKDYDECIQFIKEHDSFNAIIQVSIFAERHPRKIYYAVDRFQSLFADGYSTNDIESIFYDEPFEYVKIQYRLLPVKKRNYPIMCSAEISKEQLLKIKDLNVPISKEMMFSIRTEILNALIEGD